MSATPDLVYAIAPMTLADVPTVAAIEQEAFTLPWPESAFRSEIAHHSSAYYAVVRYLPWVSATGGASHAGVFRRLDDSLLAYGAYWEVVEEAHICTLAVRMQWRGRGLGAFMLLGLLEEAIARGASAATLEVRVSNIVAQNLYHKFGFQHVGERKRYYTDNDEDALIMTVQDLTAPGYLSLLAERRTEVLQRLCAHVQPPAEGYGQRRPAAQGEPR